MAGGNSYELVDTKKSATDAFHQFSRNGTITCIYWIIFMAEHPNGRRKRFSTTNITF